MPQHVPNNTFKVKQNQEDILSPTHAPQHAQQMKQILSVKTARKITEESNITADAPEYFWQSTFETNACDNALEFK